MLKKAYNKTYDQYAEDKARRYPRNTRSDLIASERAEAIITVVLGVVIYGGVTWLMWKNLSPDWAKGYATAVVGIMFSHVTETLNRIAAFKRLMPKD